MKKKPMPIKFWGHWEQKNIHHVFYSATKNMGRKELQGMIIDALETEKDEIE